MKKSLPILLLAVVTFLAVLIFLWLRGQDDDDLSPVDSDSPFSPRLHDPLEGTTPSRAERDEGAAARVEETTGDVAAGRGQLEVIAALPDGQRPAELEVLVDPAGEAPDATDRGFLFAELATGRYQVTVHGGDLVPITRRAVAVEDGKKTVVEFAMVRGIRPRGRLEDALDKRRIANASIDFNGMAEVFTDENGQFELQQILPRSALKKIIVNSPEYDRQIYRELVITDPEDILLVLGGGEGQIVGEVVNSSGRPLPDRFEVRVTIEPLYHTRRSFFLEKATTFRIDNLYVAKYRLELHFPGGEFPTQYREVTMTPQEPHASVRINLEAGATLRGKLIAPAALGKGIVVELRNIRNEVMASTTMTDSGNYILRGLAPGKYFPTLRVGGMQDALPELVIADSGGLVKDIDVVRRRFRDT